MANMLLCDAIEANLHNEYLYNDILTGILEEYVRNNSTFNRNTLAGVINGFQYDPECIVRALLHGIHTIYDENGSRVEFIDLPLTKPITLVAPMPELFLQLDDLYEWAKHEVLEHGALSYEEGNPKLGKFKNVIYQKLIQEGIAVIGPFGLQMKMAQVLPNGAASIVSKVCTQCNEAKEVAEFPQSRNMCRACYNANRRSGKTGHEQSAEVNKSTINDIEKLIKTFSLEQRKMMQQHREDLKRLNDEFKDNLKEILEYVKQM